MVSQHRPPGGGRRIVVTTLRVIGGVIAGLFLFFFCERMFAGYPQYGTDIITYAGLALIMATGGYAWVTDHRRLDAGGEPAARETDAND